MNTNIEPVDSTAKADDGLIEEFVCGKRSAKSTKGIVRFVHSYLKQPDAFAQYGGLSRADVPGGGK